MPTLAATFYSGFSCGWEKHPHRLTVLRVGLGADLVTDRSLSLQVELGADIGAAGRDRVRAWAGVLSLAVCAGAGRLAFEAATTPVARVRARLDPLGAAPGELFVPWDALGGARTEVAHAVLRGFSRCQSLALGRDH